MIRWRAAGTTLKDAWPAGLVLAGLAAAGCLGLLVSATGSDAVRYAGMILQILGLGTVGVGLSKTRELFGRPSIPARIKAWFGQLVAAFRRPKPIVVRPGAAELFLHAESPEVVVGPPANATIEQRVVVLEQNLALVRQKIEQHAQAARHEARQLEGRLAAEDQRLRNAVDANTKRIEDAAIGGLHLEVVGICWLFFGIVGTSIPSEVACGLAKLVRAG